MCCLAVFNGGICQDHQPRVTWKSMAGQVSLQWMVSKSTSWIQLIGGKHPIVYRLSTCFKPPFGLLVQEMFSRNMVNKWWAFSIIRSWRRPVASCHQGASQHQLARAAAHDRGQRDGSAVVRWRRMAILEAKKTSDGCFMVDQCMLCIHRMFTMFYYGWSMHVMYT